MRKSICGAIAVGLLSAGAVSASTIAVGLGADSHAMPGWEGRVEFYASPTPSTAVDVEYAVFTSEQFALSSYSGGANPAPGGYVYAYQLYNDLDPNDPVSGNDGADHDAITKFSVGIPAGAPTSGINFVAGADKAPSAKSFAGNPITTAAWYFSFSQGKQLPFGSRSDVLYFASASPPEWNSSSLLGTVGVTASVASASVPEPTAAILLVAGGACALLKRRRR